MLKLSDLLIRFRNVLGESRRAKEAARAAVKEICGVEIDPSEVSISGSELHLHTTAVTRNELMIKQEDLLNTMRAKAETSHIKKLCFY